MIMNKKIHGQLIKNCHWYIVFKIIIIIIVNKFVIKENATLYEERLQHQKRQIIIYLTIHDFRINLKYT